MGPHSCALFSLIKAFKLVLVPPLCLLPCWLSSLLQRKQSNLLLSTGFHGGHLLQDLLYFLAILAVVRSPSGESGGDAQCLRVKGGCKVPCPAQRVTKTNYFCASGVEGYMRKNLIFFFPFCWQLLASRLPKYWEWGCSWVVLAVLKCFLAMSDCEGADFLALSWFCLPPTLHFALPLLWCCKLDSWNDPE